MESGYDKPRIMKAAHGLRVSELLDDSSKIIYIFVSYSSSKETNFQGLQKSDMAFMLYLDWKQKQVVFGNGERSKNIAKERVITQPIC